MIYNVHMLGILPLLLFFLGDMIDIHLYSKILYNQKQYVPLLLRVLNKPKVIQSYILKNYQPQKQQLLNKDSIKIPGISSDITEDSKVVFAQYKYMYKDDQYSSDGIFEILYSEIYDAMIKLYKDQNIYKYNEKQFRNIVDNLITSKKKQAYLLQHCIQNNDVQMANEINKIMIDAQKTAEANLIDQYLLHIYHDEFANIDIDETRKSLGQERCYVCSHVIVNSSKIANYIYDYTESMHFARTSSPKDAFYKYAGKYASIEKLIINQDDQYITESDIKNFFGSETYSMIETMTEYNHCVAPIKISDSRYLIIFVEDMTLHDYSDDKVSTIIQNEFITSKVKEITKKMLDAGQYHDIDTLNLSQVESGYVIFAISIDGAQYKITINDLYNMFSLINIKPEQYQTLQEQYQKQVLHVLFNMAISKLSIEIYLSNIDIKSILPQEFQTNLRFLINEKLNELLYKICKSKSEDIPDTQLIEAYPEIVNQKRLEGCAIFCANKNIFTDVYSNIMREFESCHSQIDKNKFFINISKDYTCEQNSTEYRQYLDKLKSLNEQWLDTEGNIVNFNDLKIGNIYSCAIQDGHYCILLLHRIYTEDINQGILNMLRKKYADDLLKQKLLHISITAEY